MTEGGEIELLEAKEGTYSVAISHVCKSTTIPKLYSNCSTTAGSDGLGNPEFNTLPKCQIHHIQSLVDELIPPGDRTAHIPWWCDTLCVPVRRSQKESRKMAIRNMRNVYHDAIKVLALDSSLVDILSDAYPIELYIRLKLSG